MLTKQSNSLQHIFTLLCLLILFTFMGAFPAFAQEKSIPKAVTSSSTQGESPDDIIETPTDPATYPGGLRAFNRDFIRHFRLSRPLTTEARVILTFFVEEDGSLSDMRVIQNPGLEISKAALAALAKTKNWIPAKHHGELVRSQFTLPITIGANTTNQRDQPNYNDLSKPAL